ncbi:hypothetical protein [Rhizobium sp. Root1203]|uniref:hypothetical protein n=1 Tax=Rhizobium sp. Root1203 TaxID=1736427 RepID=UPI000AB20E55|nr:hypothetical protein [Rhizobium sp. Root1203]
MTLMALWRLAKCGSEICRYGSPAPTPIAKSPHPTAAHSFRKKPGAVSTIFQLKVGDIEGVMQHALAAGAVIRDEIQTDMMGRGVATILDPFNHIWALVERKAEGMSLAA